MIDEVTADRRMDAGHERQSQLGADAVGARDQHGVVQREGIEPEETAERSDVGEDARGERPAGKVPDAADDFVPRIDVDTGLTVVHQNSSFWISASAVLRVGEPAGACQ